MKKLMLFALCAALLLGTACIQITLTTPGAAPTQEAAAIETTPAPTDAPAQQLTAEPTAEPVPEETETPALIAPATPVATPYEPDLSMLPIQYSNLEEEPDGTLLTVDLGFDGHAEAYRYHFDKDARKLTIYADDTPVYEADVWLPSRIIFVDLDPETPYANILLVTDEGFQHYATTELHPEGGKLATGVTRGGIRMTDEGTLREEVWTNLLGTKSGTRPVAGEQLEPTSEWIDCEPITAEDWSKYRMYYYDCGIFLYTKKNVEVRINGEKAQIKKGTYLYVVRFNESNTLVEVCTEAGVHAMIEAEAKGNSFLLFGVSQDKLFENIWYDD